MNEFQRNIRTYPAATSNTIRTMKVVTKYKEIFKYNLSNTNRSYVSATRFVAGFSITYYSILICSNVSLECIHSLERIRNRWFVVQFGTNLCNLEQIELDQQITLPTLMQLVNSLNLFLLTHRINIKSFPRIVPRNH